MNSVPSMDIVIGIAGALVGRFTLHFLGFKTYTVLFAFGSGRMFGR